MLQEGESTEKAEMQAVTHNMTETECNAMNDEQHAQQMVEASKVPNWNYLVQKRERDTGPRSLGVIRGSSAVISVCGSKVAREERVGLQIRGECRRVPWKAEPARRLLAQKVRTVFFLASVECLETAQVIYQIQNTWWQGARLKNNMFQQKGWQRKPWKRFGVNVSMVCLTGQ